MKKFLRITGISLLSVIVLLLVLPFAFQGPLEKIAKEYVSEYTNNEVTVDWNKFGLSFITSFPHLRAGISDVLVVNKGRFDGDTLLYIKKLRANLDIMSALKGDIKVNRVLLDSPKVRGIVGADSIANWQCFLVEDSLATEEEVEDTLATEPIKINLKKVEIVDADIAYLDSTGNMAAWIQDLDLVFSGVMQGDVMNANIDLDVDKINVWMDGTRYLKNSTVTFDADIEADLEKNMFKFAENTLNFSNIPLAFDGWVKLNENGSIDTDIALEAKETKFSTILALVPQQILKQVDGLQTEGALEMYLKAKGTYVNMDTIPSIDAAIKISDGMIKYPDLPKQLRNININLTAQNPSGSADLTVVDIDKFHFDLGENPFDIKLNLIKPISNPTFKVTTKGVINLGSLKEALPLDSMSIDGVVKADLYVASNLNDIEKERYEKVNANGTIDLNTFHFEGSALPNGVDISEATLKFSPKFLELDPLKIVLGKSDFSVKGKLENYLPYILSKGTVKGKLDLNSTFIDANELMNLTSSEEEVQEEEIQVQEQSTGIVEIPSNIDFSFATKIDKLLYDKLTIENIHGGVSVKDGVANLYQLLLNLCDGEIGLNGKYMVKTQKAAKVPAIDMDIYMKGVEINKLTNSFSTIDTLLPIAKKAHGKATIGLAIVADLDNTMSPVLSSINGHGSLASQQLGIKGSNIQNKLMTVTGSKKWEDLVLKDFKLKYKIEEGKILVDPFDIKMFGKKAQFSGVQGLDQTMEYTLSIPTERSEIAQLLSKANISAQKWSEGADIPLGIKITGQLSSPEVKLDLEAAKDAIIGEVKQQVTDKAKDVAKTAAEGLKDIISNTLHPEEGTSNKQAAKDAAQKAADKLKKMFQK